VIALKLQYIIVSVSDGIRNSVTMVGGIYSLYTISPHLTAIICITVPVLVVVGNFYGRYYDSSFSIELHNRLCDLISL